MISSSQNSQLEQVADTADSPLQTTNFSSELATVEGELQSSLQGLYTPLLRLVQSQLNNNRPLHRAAFVLAVATPPQDNPEIYTSRIFLAAALEMLHMALSVHHLLLTPQQTDNDHTIEKSILGSIILAGDYCFSRAAALATRTNRYKVVEIFSQALQTVSEEQLRKLFHPAEMKEEADLTLNLDIEGNNILFQAAVRAASSLIGFSPEMERAYVDYATTLPSQLAHQDVLWVHPLPPFIPLLNPQQAEVWGTYITWLNHSTIDSGEVQTKLIH